MMKQLMHFFLIFFAITNISISTVAQINLYVSPSGNDNNTGELNSSLKTPEGARLKIRALKRKGTNSPITVNFRGGDYTITNSFTLTEQDGGSYVAPIIYQAYPGEKVRFLGGISLKSSDFTPISSESLKNRIISVEARDKVVQVNLKAKSIADYGQIVRRGFYLAQFFPNNPAMELFMNGVPMTLSRWPNDSEVSMNEILDPGPMLIPATYPTKGNKIDAEKNLVYAKKISHLSGGLLKGKIFGPTLSLGSKSPDFLKRGGKFSYAYDRPGYWNTQGADIWITGIFGWSWEGSYNKVDSIDQEAKTIRLRYGEVSGIIKQWYPDKHHYENIFEEVDMPGEYYVDRKNGVLYFYPPVNFNSTSEISLSAISTPMITIDGASNLTFKDIILSTGRSDAILQKKGNGNRFVNVEVYGFAGNGIQILDGTDNGISSSSIHHIGQRGVVLGGGDFNTLTHANNFIEYSNIYNNAYYNKTYNPAVNTGNGSVGNRISNNHIYNTPHLAVGISGSEHLIEKNEIHDVALEFSDMGAIYFINGTRPGERGHIFRNNYLHDIGMTIAGVEGIYPDNESQGVTIEGNLFYRMGGNAVNINSGAYITVRNNIFVDCKTPYNLSYHSYGASNNTSTWSAYFSKYNFATMLHGKKYPELLSFMSQGAEGRKNTPYLNAFTNNLIYNPTVPLREADGIKHPDKPKLKTENNVITTSDPGFIDWANGNFGIKSGVDLKKLIPGFLNIPFESIGNKK